MKTLRCLAVALLLAASLPGGEADALAISQNIQARHLPYGALPRLGIDRHHRRKQPRALPAPHDDAKHIAGIEGLAGDATR